MPGVIVLVDTPRLRRGYNPIDAVLDLKNKFGRGKVADLVVSVAYSRRKDTEKKPVRFCLANLRQVLRTGSAVQLSAPLTRARSAPNPTNSRQPAQFSISSYLTRRSELGGGGSRGGRATRGGRQPARASVLAVFEPEDDRGFFFGVGLPARTAIDVANTSLSAATQCCSAWPCTQPYAVHIS